MDDDPVERTLLATLRAEPADRATREVYADWLEQHGHGARASFLRLDAAEPPDDAALAAVATPVDADWRAITSRAPIAKCVTFTFACPRRWDALAPTATDGVRHCAGCDRPVYFCATIDEARAHGAARECVAIDAGLTRTAAIAAYDEHDDMTMMGEVAVDELFIDSLEPAAQVAPIIEQPANAPWLARLRSKLRRSP